ncbi:MAG: glycosyltransferase family 2 protein [Acidiferrobacterales bacterium]
MARLHNKSRSHSSHFEIVAQGERRAPTPSVTVAISLYNYEEFIASCVESVREQTLSELDLVVVDDCSTDGSVGVVCDWLIRNGDRFAGYLFIRHKSNQGLAGSRNTAFENARTKFVFVLDADNLLYPRCLERLRLALENCDASFSYCYLEKFGEEHGLQNTHAWKPDSLRHGNTVDAMVLLRKSVWQEIKGYSVAPVMGWEDFELWFKIARIGGWGILVPEILARYRVHGKSMLKNVTNRNMGKLWSHLRSTYPEFFTK